MAGAGRPRRRTRSTTAAWPAAPSASAPPGWPVLAPSAGQGLGSAMHQSRGEGCATPAGSLGALAAWRPLRAPRPPPLRGSWRRGRAWRVRKPQEGSRTAVPLRAASGPRAACCSAGQGAREQPGAELVTLHSRASDWVEGVPASGSGRAPAGLGKKCALGHGPPATPALQRDSACR